MPISKPRTKLKKRPLNLRKIQAGRIVAVRQNGNNKMERKAVLKRTSEEIILSESHESFAPIPISFRLEGGWLVSNKGHRLKIMKILEGGEKLATEYLIFEKWLKEAAAWLESGGGDEAFHRHRGNELIDKHAYPLASACFNLDNASFIFFVNQYLKLGLPEEILIKLIPAFVAFETVVTAAAQIVAEEEFHNDARKMAGAGYLMAQMFAAKNTA